MHFPEEKTGWRWLQNTSQPYSKENTKKISCWW